MLDYGVKNRNQTGLRKPNRIFKHWFFFVLACVWCSLVKKKCRARSWHSSSAFSDAHKSHDRSESCERAKWTLKGKEDRQKWKILWLTSMAMQLFSSVTAPEKNHPDVELGVNWVSWHLNEGRKKKNPNCTHGHQAHPTVKLLFINRFKCLRRHAGSVAQH